MGLFLFYFQKTTRAQWTLVSCLERTAVKEGQETGRVSARMCSVVDGSFLSSGPQTGRAAQKVNGTKRKINYYFLFLVCVEAAWVDREKQSNVFWAVSKNFCQSNLGCYFVTQQAQDATQSSFFLLAALHPPHSHNIFKDPVSSSESSVRISALIDWLIDWSVYLSVKHTEWTLVNYSLAIAPQWHQWQPHD